LSHLLTGPCHYLLSVYPAIKKFSLRDIKNMACMCKYPWIFKPWWKYKSNLNLRNKLALRHKQTTNKQINKHVSFIYITTEIWSTLSSSPKKYVDAGLICFHIQRVKRPVYKAYHSSLSRLVVVNERSYTSITLHAFMECKRTIFTLLLN
jgi:hypothetical protein